MQTAVDDLLNSVDSVLKSVVRQKLRVALRKDDFREQSLDAMDVLQDIRLKLVRKLSRDEDEGEGESIRDFKDYAAKVAYTTISDYIRSKYPEWTSLRNSLRRILDKGDEFALWTRGTEESSRDYICGYVGWKNAAFQTNPGKVMELRNNPYLLPPEALPQVPVEAMKWPQWKALLEGVFQYADGPVPLDDLVGILAPITGMEDIPNLDDSEDTDDDNNDLTFLTSSDPGPYSIWLTTERLKLYWAAVLQLLVWHRCAYLLNIRDGDLEALPLYGVASIEEIGGSLEFKNGHFSRLSSELKVDEVAPVQSACGPRFLFFWKYLPLEDNVIAVVLEATRAQVIGYRNKAKERLKRMLKGEL